MNDSRSLGASKAAPTSPSLTNVSMDEQFVAHLLEGSGVDFQGLASRLNSTYSELSTLSSVANTFRHAATPGTAGLGVGALASSSSDRQQRVWMDAPSQQSASPSIVSMPGTAALPTGNPSSNALLPAPSFASQPAQLPRRSPTRGSPSQRVHSSLPAIPQESDVFDDSDLNTASGVGGRYHLASRSNDGSRTKPDGGNNGSASNRIHLDQYSRPVQLSQPPSQRRRNDSSIVAEQQQQALYRQDTYNYSSARAGSSPDLRFPDAPNGKTGRLDQAFAPLSDARASQSQSRQSQQQQKQQLDVSRNASRSLLDQDGGRRIESFRHISASVGSLNDKDDRHSDHPLYASGSMPQMTSLASDWKILQDVSSHLVSFGIPALPEPLLVASSGSTHIPGTLSETQAKELRNLVFTITSQITKKERLVDDIKRKLEHAEASLAQARSAQSATMSATNELDKLRASQSSANQQVSSLTAEVAAAKQECEMLRTQLSNAAKQSSEDGTEIERLRFQIQEMMHQQDQTRRRDLQTLADMKQKYGRFHQASISSVDPLDNFLVEVIRAYEAKLDDARKQAAASASASASERNSATLRSSQAQRHQQDGSMNANGAESGELEKQLTAALDALDASQHEVEVLKLKLLNTSGKVDRDAHRTSKGRISTRELIQRDKRVWKNKLTYIDVIPEEQARELLKDMCLKLSVQKVEQLPFCMDRIRLVLKLIVQLENFVRSVDSIVRAHTIDEEGLPGNEDRDGGYGNQTAPRKLTFTLEVIRQWAELASDAGDLKASHLDACRPRLGSDAHCIEEIRSMVAGVGGGLRRHPAYPNMPVDIAQQAASHFCQLYSLSMQSPTAMISQMNTLFVFQKEVEDGLDRLRSALNVEGSLRPGSVLARAAKIIEESADWRRSVEQVVETSRSVQLDGLDTPASNNTRAASPRLGYGLDKDHPLYGRAGRGQQQHHQQQPQQHQQGNASAATRSASYAMDTLQDLDANVQAYVDRSKSPVLQGAGASRQQAAPSSSRSAAAGHDGRIGGLSGADGGNSSSGSETTSPMIDQSYGRAQKQPYTMVSPLDRLMGKSDPSGDYDSSFLTASDVVGQQSASRILRRAGRSAGGGDKSRAARLQRLRELRESGQTGLQDYETQESVDVFEEVTEEEYRAIAKRAALNDSFVSSDGDDAADGDDGDDGRKRSKSKSGKGSSKKTGKRRRDDRDGRPAQGNTLTDMFSKQSKSASMRSSDKPVEPATAASTNDLLASIFLDMDEHLENNLGKRTRISPPKPVGRGGSSSYSAMGFDDDAGDDNYDPYAGSSSPLRPHSKQPQSALTSKPVADLSVAGADRVTTTDAPTDPVAADTTHDDHDDALSHPPLPVKQELIVPAVQVRKLQTAATGRKPTKLAAAHFLPKFERAETETPAVTAGGASTVVSASDMADCTNWKSVKDSVNVRAYNAGAEGGVDGSGSNSSTMGPQSILEADGSLNMFWFDCMEKNGVVYLFGKVLQASTGKYVSCCLIVKNIQRNVFLLPRRKRLDDAGVETDRPVEIGDVYEEFDQIRKHHKITEYLSNKVTRKYAFELSDVPDESEYLKVVYPFSQPELPAKLSGKTFSRAFGTNTRILELFILKRRLMGPCWINIKNAQVTAANISWCKFDVTVTDPKDVKTFSDGDPNAPKQAPPLVVMSLSLRTYMNKESRANEIVAVSALVFNNVSIENASTDPNASRFTAVRQLNDIPIPVEFGDLAAREQAVMPTVLPNERGLLNLLIAKIHLFDPDVLVGHNIVDFDLDVLLHRMKANQVLHWSRIGRLRRTVWPQLQGGAGGTGDSSFAEKQIACGRLMCDTYRAAQDLVRAKSYSLTYLAANLLKIERHNIDFEKIPTYFWSGRQLLDMIQHCEFDTFLTYQIMNKLQVLPLTKQLTCLAGNLWSRSLMGARAERNEYLLLHEFHAKKYICPDRTAFGSNTLADQLHDNDDEHADGAAAGGAGGKKAGRRKAAYAGGLVLEPKRGFYDKYVLLLDFNSLYPSIIQEYNICFTTVTRTYDGEGDHMPDPPEPTVAKGILPKLLGTLVDRRRLVKGLMKDPRTTPEELAQYDIRQKALKLTANSMYGCLGFAHSRFYAKPLAMLITAKGREILQSTVDLATQSELEVIYGDTDSIMIHTNTTDLAQVKRMGQELKRAVNKRYNLLEIEMDGFYQRMLLLMKKKYAAIMVEEMKDGTLKTTLETKGLDLVRRDWCGLSGDASTYVLNQIFSGENREDVVDRIHQYLTKLGEEARQELIPLEKFIINKARRASLTKNPEEYADKGSQPHVQVALQLKARGISAKTGDTIPYVICKGEEQQMSQRARHPEDVTREGSTEKIDIEWYLSNQVHPPVSRLCQPIDGTDAARIADCLGLDVAKYRQQIASSMASDELLGGEVFTLESQLTEQERFKDVVRWKPRCVHCDEAHEFTGLVRFEQPQPATKEEENKENAGQVAGGSGSKMRVASGLECPNPLCRLEMPVASLAVQLRVALCAQMRAYLDQGVVCDDPSCHTKTRATSVYGRRCLFVGCKGTVSLQYSDRSLYLQMQYYESLLDTASVTKRLESGAIEADLASQAKGILVHAVGHTERLRQLVARYLAINARRWVDLGQLFAFGGAAGAAA
ncbi:DNA polymerase family B-domain-containing protein [Entophlyctis helioformis]|nr:DNA polymerase family B-domain-containing protein [Entophlyctis helioformis]